MNDSKAMQITYKMMTDRSPFPVNISIQHCMLVISALQLAEEHPHISPFMSGQIKGIIAAFGEQLVGLHPDAAVLVASRAATPQDVLEAVAGDNTRVIVKIDVHQAWLFISSIQLLTRHPDLADDVKTHVVDLALQFQVRIVAIHPDCEQLIEMGWDPTFDVRGGRA